MADQRFILDPTEAGQRLDKIVISKLQGVGRKGARRLFEEGRILVNRRRASKGDVAQAGDELSILVLQTAAPGAVPEPGAPLAVRFETDSVVVVEKPAGQPTGPLRPGELGTLANALVARFPEMAGVGHGPREPGLVHRLDNDTSGLVIAARTPEAFRSLSLGLKAGKIDKTYLLVCPNTDLAETGTIAIPLAHHPKDRRRMHACIHPRDVERYLARPATTSFRVLEKQGPWALVEAKAKAALRHQIRVHLAATDHPLANDRLYGGAAVADIEGHALHASRVVWTGDAVVPAFTVDSPMPEKWSTAFGFRQP